MEREKPQTKRRRFWHKLCIHRFSELTKERIPGFFLEKIIF